MQGLFEDVRGREGGSARPLRGMDCIFLSFGGFHVMIVCKEKKMHTIAVEKQT
jgi:hypothetical protein